MKDFRYYLGLILKGGGIGAANVIPGVSGGTLAFITGIYEKLLNSLNALDGEAIKMFFRGHWTSLARKVNADFLAALFIGFILSILTLARVLEFWFEVYPVLLWAFFFGLILASVFSIGREIGHWDIKKIVLLLVGAALAFSVAVVKPSQENASMVYLFICGVLAISSMVLPGLSGSFILILLGNYMLVLRSINTVDLAVITPFMIGCGAGLIVFAKVLSWVFRHYHDATIALMTGFVFGSLYVIWPWKEAVEFIEKPDGSLKEVAYERFLPDPSLPYTWLAIACMVAGALLVWSIDKMGNTQKEV